MNSPGGGGLSVASATLRYGYKHLCWDAISTIVDFS